MVATSSALRQLYGPEAIASVVRRRFNGGWQPAPAPLHTGFLAGGKK